MSYVKHSKLDRKRKLKSIRGVHWKSGGGEHGLLSLEDPSFEYATTIYVLSCSRFAISKSG